jgi:hypothetical protein
MVSREAKLGFIDYTVVIVIIVLMVGDKTIGNKHGP